MSSLAKRFKVGILALSSAGLIAIANFEGFEEKAYIPVPGDDPTIGFGHKDERIRHQTRRRNHQEVREGSSYAE